MLKKYVEFINEEVGLRNIKSLLKGEDTCEIYFHKDLDGVTSALAMKYYLETYYNVKTVDCHIIQYGGLEFAIKNTKEGNVPVLVDFAHSKPMFTIATDHHDSQVGDEDTDSTYYKSARSNVEIISGEISHTEIFTKEDIDLIKTVDSADFLSNDIKPEDVQNSIFNYKKAESASKNRYMMGFVVNRLLLAYKNKRITVKSLDGKTDHINRNILECLVLDSTPSLYSMFNNIRHYINNAKTNDKLGKLAEPEDIAKNLSDYVTRMKNYTFVETKDGTTHEISQEELNVLRNINNLHDSEFVKFAKQMNITKDELVNIIDKLMDKKYLFFNDRSDRYFVGNYGKKVLTGNKAIKGVHMDDEYDIIVQYGGGNMFKPGSYDRYTPFKNFPEADFLCIVWPMGLIQVSCNPFKEKKIKGINLGEISKEVLSKYEPNLSKYYISLESIKNEFETSQDWKNMKREEGEDYEGVGFKFSDLEAFYKDCVYEKKEGKIVKVDVKRDDIKDAMDTIHENLTSEQKELLNSMKIPVWELIIRNSGGHPSITNIAGLSFLKYNKRVMKILYKTEKYVDILKMIARDFVDTLKDKINKSKEGGVVSYDTKGIELLGENPNE
jgi:hypothetical protein